MTRTRLGLLGLCAMVFGLMAFSATAAHAEVGAKWLILKNGVLVPNLVAQIQLKKDKNEKSEDIPLVLHTEISKVPVLFLCTTPEALNAKLEGEGKISEGSKIRFSGCSTDLNGSPAKACEPKAAGDVAGTIVTKPGHGLIELVILKNAEGKEIGKDNVVRILPDKVGGVESNIFATIEMGEECSIGTKVNVLGKAVLKDCKGNGSFTTHAVEHLVEVGSEAEGTKLFAISETAEHKALILGSTLAFLIGEHLGLLWSGDPN